MQTDTTLKQRVSRAIQWSFDTWKIGHKVNVVTDSIFIHPLAGSLYHINFRCTTHVEWFIAALYLDTGYGQSSLFFDSNTLAVIESFVLAEREE